MTTKLSVNINKIATLRNSRGGNMPNVLKAAIDCEAFGADGITVHPRPDERHIRYLDVHDIAKQINVEFNIEGNPKEEKFVQLVLDVKPAQVTLVPDDNNQLTSNHGWDTQKEKAYLKEIITVFKNAGIRTSIFIDPVPEMAKYASETGADRVELYTEFFAKNYPIDSNIAIKEFITTAHTATQYGLGINAGHDLSLENLNFFAKTIPNLLEVSIGHALISDAIYYGLQNTIQMYKRALL